MDNFHLESGENPVFSAQDCSINLMVELRWLEILKNRQERQIWAGFPDERNLTQRTLLKCYLLLISPSLVLSTYRFATNPHLGFPPRTKGLIFSLSIIGNFTTLFSDFFQLQGWGCSQKWDQYWWQSSSSWTQQLMRTPGWRQNKHRHFLLPKVFPFFRGCWSFSWVSPPWGFSSCPFETAH